ncbi:MAG: metallophosphoesterase family protein [Oscillospiraceae bacterium]
MIYITGDTHGGFQRFGNNYFPQQKHMSREDYVIITGDFGRPSDAGPKDWYWLDWLSGKPFTTLFVDGNHENFDLLNALPEKEWHGGRVHE